VSSTEGLFGLVKTVLWTVPQEAQGRKKSLCNFTVLMFGRRNPTLSAIQEKSRAWTKIQALVLWCPAISHSIPSS